MTPNATTPISEDPLLAEEVAERAADEDQRAEREQVRVDDPLLEREPAAEVVLDRGQRDVDDGRVDEHDRRAEDAGDEDQSFARLFAQMLDTSSQTLTKEGYGGLHDHDARRRCPTSSATTRARCGCSTGALGNEQVAITYRRMPQHTGGKGSYGHRHTTQEEIYFVISGRLQFKLDDEVVEGGPGTAVRVAPEVVRSVWNDEPEDAELMIVSTRDEDSKPEYKADFWPF